MRKFFTYIRENIRLIIVVFLFVISAIIIAYLFPRQGKFKYEFRKTEIWKHNDLKAPFDFPVYKSESRITEEKDSVMRFFKPYFTFDAYTANEQIEKFQETFDRKWSEYTIIEFKIDSEREYQGNNNYNRLRELGNQFRNYISDQLRIIYLNGIIETGNLQEELEREIISVYVVKGNIGQESELADIFTPKSAYEYLKMNLSQYITEINTYYIKRYREFFRQFDLNDFIKVNVNYDENKSEQAQKEMFDKISLTRGMIQKGQLIISNGEIVTNEKFRILESLKIEYEHQLGFMANQLVKLGKLILVSLSMLVIFLFLYNFRREVLSDSMRTGFILFLFILIMIIASVTVSLNKVHIYVIPFVILPIILRTFYDERLALFIHFIAILLIGFFAPNSFEFVFLNSIAGMVAIFSLTNLYRRSKLVITALLVIATYCLLYFGILIVKEGTVANINYEELTSFVWFGINGTLILIAYPLIYVFEKTFGFLSDATLFELSDTNQPLLRKLAETAPGTFQHSLQVANLAEEAILKVGGDPLLVRTAALYHDIGKMENPIYYIENQTSDINPHDSLEFEESAKIIISHVEKGVETARKNNLPQAIIEFIKTHHGTTTVQYFYRSYIKKYPEEEVDAIRFSYPGPKPFSKETAVLMMADAVEAASRSLKTINEKTLEKTVENIINYQQKEGQYNNANITFRDISTIKAVLLKRLKNIYHARIEYPH
ncbi:MAG: HDIG domain-containing protein [Bacteroidales bacterium]|nr:MAG: HDIG domain-containing protein [Bacteroidales bacterium]